VVACAIITAFGLVLFLPGLKWGLPGTSDWSQDSIAGMRTIGAVAEWPGEWHGIYPPLHYLILRAAYEPVLRQWRSSGELRVEADTGRHIFAPPHEKKIGSLIFFPRLVSVVLGIFAAIGLMDVTLSYLIASTRASRIESHRRDTSCPVEVGVNVPALRNNESPYALGAPPIWVVAAGVAALAMMTGPAYVFFAHNANVDIPQMFWFVGSLYFYVRALHGRRAWDAALLGFFGSLAISTKASVAGVYPGMAILLLFREVAWFASVKNVGQDGRETRSAARFGGSVLRAVFQPRWFLGLLLFAVPFLVINGAPWNPSGFIDRMENWMGVAPESIHARYDREPNQWALLQAAAFVAGAEVGWPLLCALIASTLYILFRRPRIAAMFLVPALSYYAIIIAPLGFVHVRFLMPVTALLCVLLGLAVADLVRRRPAVRWGVWAGLIAVFVPTLCNAFALILEMRNDTRYEAERWFVEHVEPPSAIGAFSHPQFLPRLSQMGFATYAIDATREAFSRPQPEFIVVTEYEIEDANADERDFLSDLLVGKMGYGTVAEFKPQYLNSSWPGLAGWGAPMPGKISPKISVLRRRF